MKPISSHHSQQAPQPSPPSGRAHIDDIVDETGGAANRETGEKVNELRGRRVGDIGVVRGERVRITAIYKNGKFDYEFLTSTR
jgi:hypothetical protein